MRVGQQSSIQDVHDLNAVGRLLHDRALKELHLLAAKNEFARNRESERSRGAAVLEEIPELVVGYAVVGLTKEARIALGFGFHLAGRREREKDCNNQGAAQNCRADERKPGQLYLRR